MDVSAASMDASVARSVVASKACPPRLGSVHYPPPSHCSSTTTEACRGPWERKPGSPRPYAQRNHQVQEEAKAREEGEEGDEEVFLLHILLGSLVHISSRPSAPAPSSLLMPRLAPKAPEVPEVPEAAHSS